MGISIFTNMNMNIYMNMNVFKFIFGNMNMPISAQGQSLSEYHNFISAKIIIINEYFVR